MQTSSYVTTVLLQARALYVILLDLKLLNEDGNLQVCMYCSMHKKEPQKLPEHTSEHVKYQNFLEPCPQTLLTQPILWAPRFLFALGLSKPLSGPAYLR